MESLNSISYMVTCHDEGGMLLNLFQLIENELSEQDEVVVIYDVSKDEDTNKIISDIKSKEGFKVFEHSLNNNYGEHKNWGNLQCKCEWIFQIDGDELPPNLLLGENLRSILSLNPNTELYFVPRLNDFKGVTPLHAKTWGWNLDYSPTTGRMKVNFPDYQGRIYKNVPSRIKWERKLHEKINGHEKFSFLPSQEDFSILHSKTIEKQVQTNIKYNQLFSSDDNRGYKL